MSTKGADRIHAILDERGCDPVDFKFFPSPEAGQGTQLTDAAADAMPALLDPRNPDKPPVSGVAKFKIVAACA